MIFVRHANRDELDEIRQFRLNAYQEYAKVMPADAWRTLSTSLLGNSDEMEGVEVLVAEQDNTIVGTIALFPPNLDAYEGKVAPIDYPEIRMLAVSTEARGEGVGRILMEKCLSEVKNKGYSAIGLHTSDFMTHAVALYRSMGFERNPQYDFFPAENVSVWSFRKAL